MSSQAEMSRDVTLVQDVVPSLDISAAIELVHDVEAALNIDPDVELVHDAEAALDVDPSIGYDVEAAFRDTTAVVSMTLLTNGNLDGH